MTEKEFIKKIKEELAEIPLEYDPMGKLSNLYVMQNQTFKTVCKIGLSNNPINRLVQIQSGNHHEIRLVIVYMEIDHEILKVEKQLHRKFKGQNIINEWFKLTSKDLKEISDLLYNYYALVPIYDEYHPDEIGVYGENNEIRS